MRITVDVPDAQIRRLEETARRLKVSPEALAAAAVSRDVIRDAVRGRQSLRTSG